MNPTTDVLEKRLAAQEGGAARWRFRRVWRRSPRDSELAVAATISSRPIALRGTYTLFTRRFPERFGIKVRFV
jgi:O-acetylhomoserine/O-acetylserine sulfhydrylase-like pyridoxal-dependent enzyme